ncbi:MAG TPA: Crp/Fnr family transcriptional regulator [Ktedonobacteraceae bacterium]|nr:Crp/Fnr family transcriptional regulator [Ktedonobacteraceae bacterium]
MLRNISYFSALSRDDLAQVAMFTVERHFNRGDLILIAGETGGSLCYVCSGLVKVFKTSPEGKEQVLRLVGAGYTFNDVPALDGGPNPASVAAVESSKVYIIKRSGLHQLIIARPEVAEAVVLTLAKTLRHLVALVEDLSLRHVTARVAKILLDQETSTRQSQKAHRLTQTEMAALVGSTREVVGRALKDLETAGAIEMHRGQAIVLNRERLRIIAL